ncbi:low molecular weight phosphatase family protein [Pedobacter alpinus]|uniref:Low molecular weight phosphatase family protein n=1 Tax=Pedobacter alpinus TaxID=1590643 RepID=A0ABW5TVE4_9SPHI
MNQKIAEIISRFSSENISDERKEVLQPLIDYIQEKVAKNECVRLNFICTHNSRRSHLSQIWAQTAAFNFGIENVFCYSGGTEATAMFPKVAETLTRQGFLIQKLAATENPIYSVKYDDNEAPVICFSKVYDNEINPKSKFGAIMTCDNADQGCPFVAGADGRFPVKYEDPKAFDHTDLMDAKYAERSLEIGEELWYVFSRV